jgi:hypothetical protein
MLADRVTGIGAVPVGRGVGLTSLSATDALAYDVVTLDVTQPGERCPRAEGGGKAIRCGLVR